MTTKLVVLLAPYDDNPFGAVITLDSAVADPMIASGGAVQASLNPMPQIPATGLATFTSAFTDPSSGRAFKAGDSLRTTLTAQSLADPNGPFRQGAAAIVLTPVASSHAKAGAALMAFNPDFFA